VPVVRAVVAALVLAFAVGAAGARAGPDLFVGVTDDAFLWRADAIAAANGLGLAAVRVTQPWTPGQSELSASDIVRLDPAAAVAAAAGLRVVVTVFGKAVTAPQDDASREAFCAYVRDLLVRYPLVNDVVIWNEPNLGFYWQPQFTNGASTAPAAYEKLLARCWDVLHAFRPGVNIVMSTSPSGNDDPGAVSNVSHSPSSFIRKLGAAYRASGRTRPLFETVGHNPYGMSSAESPWRQHFAPSHIGEADLDRLVAALDDAFDGTPQAVPGGCVDAGLSCVSVWYLEAGYQTIPDSQHQSAYVGRENDARAVTDAASGDQSGPTQSTQLVEGIELAYCQPYVTAFFNFLLWDEFDLARWQSGVFWADGTKKASYDALRRVVAALRTGGIDCRALRTLHGTSAQRSGAALIERIEWPSLREYSVFNEIWQFAVRARTDLSYRATLGRLQPCDRSAAVRCWLVLAGALKRGRPSVLEFPQRRLAPGTYRIRITVTSRRAPGMRATRQSAPFAVK
jgi:hypothetical protein